jgi:hypothetical protein
LQDWLPENQLARFRAEVSNELDLTTIYAAYERKDKAGKDNRLRICRPNWPALSAVWNAFATPGPSGKKKPRKCLPKRRKTSRRESQAGRPNRKLPHQRKRIRSSTKGTERRLRRARQNAESPTREYNFVDPDSRLMMDTARKAFAQAYHAQAAADEHAQVIVAAEVTQDTNDRAQLLPLVRAVRDAACSAPQVITADVGYWDTLSLRDSMLNGIDVLVSPDSKPQPPDAMLAPQVPHTQEEKRMRERLATEAGKALYAKRKTTIEPVFGQIKEARAFRRFRLRGLKRVNAEWKLICATHNLLKLFRHRINLLAPSAPVTLARGRKSSSTGRNSSKLDTLKHN